MGSGYKKKRITVPQPRQSTYTYEQLYDEFWGKFQALFAYSIKDYHMGEDLAQEVMIRVWRYWDRIQWDKLAGALGVIVNNVRYDYLKDNFDKPDKNFYEDELEFDHHDSGITDPLRKLIIERAADVVQEFAEALKNEDREIFLDFYTRDFDIDDLCNKYGMKKTHVYVKLFRIRDLLLFCTEDYDLLPEGDWNNG
ncbi:RNA polymerase ECF sigma factor [Trabzonvirus APT65]|uniref:RNA polymerase ECF sigma factor n=1 Tax=Aeromonas phage APT65 TaxID=2982914 RepID=A0A9E8K2H0_9CAUD|nr:RNA polymerase ECF sigma factor [Aeromonas phage APT65]